MERIRMEEELSNRMIRLGLILIPAVLLVCWVTGCGDDQGAGGFPPRSVISGDRVEMCSSVGNPDISIETMVRGLVDLTENGDVRLVRRILKCPDLPAGDQVADAVATILLDDDHLGSTDEAPCVFG